jgi:hypothetical protein
MSLQLLDSDSPNRQAHKPANSRVRENYCGTRELRWFRQVAQRENTSQECAKSPSGKAVADESQGA